MSAEERLQQTITDLIAAQAKSHNDPGRLIGLSVGIGRYGEVEQMVGESALDFLERAVEESSAASDEWAAELAAEREAQLREAAEDEKHERNRERDRAERETGGCA
jgi:acyl-CoA reductase-like NAD-dependent aldehyde dehydrogenase